MFEQFLSHFRGTPANQSPAAYWQPEELSVVEGYEYLMRQCAGFTFVDGLYRLHDRLSAQIATKMIAEMFPRRASRLFPFAYDWLGRQFAIDQTRASEGQPLVMLLEPGTGAALEVPDTFVDFHDSELVRYQDAAVAVDMFSEWVDQKHPKLPLRRDQCAGYVVPLFLGGRDEVANLETVDVEVYWSVSAQLLHGTKNLAQGQRITNVKQEP